MGDEATRILSIGTPLCMIYLYTGENRYSSQGASLNYILNQPLDIKLILEHLGYKIEDPNISTERRQAILKYLIQKPVIKYSELNIYVNKLLNAYQHNSNIACNWDVIKKLQNDIRYIKQILLSEDLSAPNYEVIDLPNDVLNV